MNESEVIAVKSKRVIYSSIIFLIALLFIISIMTSLLGKLGEVTTTVPLVFIPYVVMIILFAGLCLFYIYHLVCWFRTPHVIISRYGDKLYFCGEEFSISDIMDIRYSDGMAGRGVNISSKFEIFLKDGRVLKSKYIADVEGVHCKLFSLVAQSKQTGDNQ